MQQAIHPFRIDIPQAQLDELQRRLLQTRWPDAQTCAGWDQGTPLSYAQALADYWAESYDWRRCEAKLNSWQQ